MLGHISCGNSWVPEHKLWNPLDNIAEHAPVSFEGNANKVWRSHRMNAGKAAFEAWTPNASSSSLLAWVPAWDPQILWRSPGGCTDQSSLLPHLYIFNQNALVPWDNSSSRMDQRQGKESCVLLSEIRLNLILPIALQENVFFSDKRPWLMTNVWGNLFRFIHYNV
jgi:hypothetical protein